MKIALIVPMPEEAEFYYQHFHDREVKMFGCTKFEHFSVNENEIYLGLSGIGKVNAAMNLSNLLARVDIDLIIMTGSAGSLKPEIKKKDVIVVNSFAYHDAHNTAAGDYVEGQIPREPARFDLQSTERAQFIDFLKTRGFNFKEGLVVTGDSFIASEAAKTVIKANFPEAVGVEMEGASFAQVAYHFNKPLIALRAISDNGDEDANESFEEFVKEAGQKAADLIISYLKR
ncbi:5'-methylthioadenosine/adenosylhomocysteine nucleosidase [Lactobacillus mulieris]|jgi:MTA/SAH nucleosidase|uniref:adenosylhomocysteine nucleosidase n=1 Tax=Lactobacillus mulieris TaxID=2508708 RepID=A0AAP3GYK5_9LACO|nr:MULTISPECIES: 5'-methylthioadenosine/adenosylhomocysteine nucleosidase [Lactobacillus]EEU21192.1 MTA/SAH nucleosidase [Lactobacillus jensenii 27-2-CHN]EEX24069.1 MTA/SAH nucleosidase [Lactobacillus jensenii 115-3-CHN]EFH29246.1 MTA/SAH nucleosidase [Lactobacillus jensenii JV-V16]KAA9245365.1 5'-methylthioadenosine/adenosylhomocysteine nucleosidase [Lactobacillus jensenii]KAA9368434.1 5'-methylthioadenosine/adenosylhomocysteine nucleosidase [Lactobacillus jensenii]